jgi:hypothetical protein
MEVVPTQDPDRQRVRVTNTSPDMPEVLVETMPDHEYQLEQTNHGNSLLLATLTPLPILVRETQTIFTLPSTGNSARTGATVEIISLVAISYRASSSTITGSTTQMEETT